MVFFIIMFGALVVALLAGWVTWRREENIRQAAEAREERFERRLAEEVKSMRSKDRR
jgi:hypothetical protein